MTDSKYDPTTQPYDEPQRHVDRTDIAERLRARIERVYSGYGNVTEIPDEDCQEAANEIERQNVEIVQLKVQAERDREYWEDMKGMSEKHRRLWVEATQEIERLREALRETQNLLRFIWTDGGTTVSRRAKEQMTMISALLEDKP